MLPWKRHKFELPAAGGPPARAPGGGAGAAPAGRARGACPAALRRVGGLFRRRRRTLRVSAEAPCLAGLYLGHAATLQARGEGCADAAVGRLWARSEAGRRGARARLSLGPQGLRLAPEDAPAHLYLLHRVTHCAADARLPRLLAWVYRHEARHKAELLRVHAVLLARAAEARALALLLLQTSAAALADFRRLKRRTDARRQQPGPAQAPPPPPRSLLLRGPAACYKPPAERGRGAPRLGPIAEDAQGEEREARDGDDEHRPPGLGLLIRGLGRLALRDADPSGDSESSADGAPRPPEPDSG